MGDTLTGKTLLAIMPHAVVYYYLLQNSIAWMLLLHIKECFSYNYGTKRSAYTLPTKCSLYAHNDFFFFNLLHLKQKQNKTKNLQTGDIVF